MKNIDCIDLLSTVNLLSELINMIFKSVRSFINLRAIFSYQDAHRCTKVFTYIFNHKSDLLKDNDHQDLENKNLIMKKITSISAVISIYVSFIVRFFHEEIDIDNEIEQRLINHPFKNLYDSKQQKICLYNLIIKYVSNEKYWPNEEFPYINDWEYVSILFAYAKCMNYIINEEKEIYPLPSLLLNLLILSLTVSISNKKSDSFKCLIVGMPGTSKLKKC